MSSSLKYRPGEKLQGFWLALPAVVWLGVFFLIPLILMFIVSFMTPRPGGAQLPFTFKSYYDIFGELRWNGQPDVHPMIFNGLVGLIIAGFGATWYYARKLANPTVIKITAAMAGVILLLDLIGIWYLQPDTHPLILILAFIAIVAGFGAAWYYARKLANPTVIKIIAVIIGGLLVRDLVIIGQPASSSFYFGVVVDSLRIAFVTTVICLILGYPLSFFIATRKNNFVRQFTLFLVILPFWTNFLVRTYAWIGILGNTENGTINGILMQLGIIQEPLTLLFTPEAVLVGLVYGFLPFMVLPIYASVERFDFHFVEAAHDLGANDFWVFLRVVLPMTLPGVVAGCILVFIPAIGAFVTPDLMGGTQGLMIGNLITGQFRGSAGNWPRGAAFSMVMMALVMISLLIYIRFGDQDE
jgi:spermidine/putrescine transport system permease protein